MRRFRLKLLNITSLRPVLKMPCIRANATMEEFRDASYMVETVYRNTEGGVWLATTTPESNAWGGLPRYWDVYFLEGATAVDVMPFAYARSLPQRISTFGEHLAASVTYTTMEDYCRANFAGQWHRHWVGYSQKHLTLDNEWYCFDLYYQSPQLAYSPYEVWLWYLMIDQCDPSSYWRGRMLYCNGMRVMGDAPNRPRL